MDDLKTLLERTASDLEPEPHGWSRVLDRRHRHQRTRRVTAAVVALVVAAGGLSLAALAIHPLTRPTPPMRSNAPGPTASDTAISVTLHADGYPASCTATVASPDVAPGDSVSVSYVIHNQGDATLQIAPSDPYGAAFGRLRVRDASGRLLFDTESRHVGQRGPGPIFPTPLPAGASTSMGSESVLVRWAGPLTLTGSCPMPSRSVNQQEQPVGFPPLPEFHLAVVPQGPTPTEAEAIDRAVAATAGLYETCHPGEHGEPVNGVLEPPAVTDGHLRVQPLPLQATCWAVVRPGAGFDDVTLYFSSPPTGSTQPASGPEGLPPVAGGRPAEVGRWEVLVLPDSAVTTEFPISEGRSPTQGDVGYDFNTRTGRWDLGGLTCIGVGGFVGGTIHLFPPSGHPPCNPHPGRGG